MLKFLKFALDPTLSIVYNTGMKDRNGYEPNQDLIALGTETTNAWGEPAIFHFLIGALRWHDAKFLEVVCRSFMEDNHPEDLKVFDRNRENLLDPTTSS